MNKEYETYSMGDYTRSYRGTQDDVCPIPQNQIDTDLNLKQHKEWGGEQTNKSIIKENNYIYYNMQNVILKEGHFNL